MGVRAGEIAVEVESEHSGHDLTVLDVFEGADVGLAVFDAGLNLVRANDLYMSLCGYRRDDVPSGTPLKSLMYRSLSRQDLSEHEIKTSVETTLLRLRVGGTHKLRFETADGLPIIITRHRNPGGTLIETVQEAAALDAHAAAADQMKNLAEAARSRMMYALDSMIDGFALYDSEDRLVFYNQRYVDLNPHIADLITPGARYEAMLRKGVERGGMNTQDMDDEAFIQWRLHQHYNPGEPSEHQLSDGRWIRVLEKQTEDGGIVGTRSDITELKRRELEIQKISGDLDETSDQFNVALNNMIQGLCMFDKDQKLILCNRQYLEMYGFSDEVVKPGIALSDIMRYSISLGNYRDEDAQAALAARHDPEKLRRRSTIKQYLRDGRVMAVMNEPMDNGGSIATYQDITVLEQHEATLVAYTKKLERSNRELQDFAYVASHDLQEPLRKIEAFGDRLLRKHGDKLPEDGKMFVDRMQNAATRMRQLINDLLGYSRVTTKAKPFRQTDLGEVLEGVLSDLDTTLHESGGRVDMGDMPIFDADPMQMRQLFQNLLSNALKFRKPDIDPVVTITAEKFKRADQSGKMIDYWRFDLADNGIGFENQYKDQIFTIFQRLHGKFEYEGTGIGLATCRKIVERHEGTIDANGIPDVGATFTIELPAVQENKEDAA